MSKGLIKKIGLFAAAWLATTALFAQTDGTYTGYTPYSVYGIGDLHAGGNAFTRSMGGAGVALRNRRFINPLNPASLTARDSLSFMADFGLTGKSVLFQQNDFKSANNTLNINDFVISFPLWRRYLAMMIGVSPFSNVGYDFAYSETNPEQIGRIGNYGYSVYGSGSINQFYVGLGGTLWNRLSLGAQFIYYFGNPRKNANLLFENSSSRSVYNGFDLQLNGMTGKFGLQYEQPLGNNYFLSLGATYRMKTPLRGYVKDYSYAILSSHADTLKNVVDTLAYTRHVSFADEVTAGLSLRRGDDWSVQVDYSRSGWEKSGFDNARGFASVGKGVFSASTTQALRAGFEFTPNRNDIRYFYRRWTYRAGAYYEQAYYKLNGRSINAYGLTLGLTIPVYAGYNGITLGLDLGQRGSLADNLVRERYIGFNIGFNIFDLWFHKRQYD